MIYLINSNAAKEYVTEKNAIPKFLKLKILSDDYKQQQQRQQKPI